MEFLKKELDTDLSAFDNKFSQSIISDEDKIARAQPVSIN